MNSACKTFRDQVVYLHDLVDRDDPGPPILEGFTFVRCQVRGPAVVYLTGDADFDRCVFSLPSRDVEEMLFEVPEGATKVGLLGLAGCTFHECQISMVALAGTPATITRIRGAFSREAGTPQAGAHPGVPG